MDLHNYDDLEWEISGTPIGSSTPDEFYELDYNASSLCPVCDEKINGIAHYWSRDEAMTSPWLERIDYEHECPND